MCLNPIPQSVRGLRQLVACRKCKQCNANRIRDFVGRCVAESKTAVHSNMITLTYGDSDDLGAKVLLKKDVDDWLKRIRAAGHPVRYFLVGEYGSKKGRSHWHALMFWQGRVPNYMSGIKEWKDKFWHKGHTQWDEFTPKEASYVCKYLLKDLEDPHQQVSGPHRSKLPPLGSFYFYRLAEKYAIQRLLPLDPGYSFPECVHNGKQRKFYLRGTACRDFALAIVAAWQDINGEHPLDRQHSDWIERELDKVARNPGVLDIERRGYERAPWLPPPEGSSLWFSEVHNTWAVDFSGRRLFWSFDEEGLRAWRSEIVTASEAERRRAASARARSPDVYRQESDGW